MQHRWRSLLPGAAGLFLAVALLVRLTAPREARDFPLMVVLVAGECRASPGEASLVPGQPVLPGTSLRVPDGGLLELATPPGGRIRSHAGEVTFVTVMTDGRLVLDVKNGLHFVDFSAGGLLELRHGSASMRGRDCRLRLEERDGVAGVEVLAGFLWPVRGEQLGEVLPVGQWQPLGGS